MSETMLGPASKRLLAMLIVTALVVLYFGSFIMAEADAYGTAARPRDGYVHAPWILGMPLAIVLGFALAGVVHRLWADPYRPTANTVSAGIAAHAGVAAAVLSGEREC